jgi:hypothetical protein
VGESGRGLLGGIGAVPGLLPSPPSPLWPPLHITQEMNNEHEKPHHHLGKTNGPCSLYIHTYMLLHICICMTIASTTLRHRRWKKRHITIFTKTNGPSLSIHTYIFHVYVNID